jgi:hypothetical protein
MSQKNRYAALSLLLIAWVAPASSAPGDALAPSRSVYRLLVSYADTGVITFWRGRRTTRTVYRAPRQFYLEVTQDADTDRSSWRYVLWCDGDDFQSWDSSSGEHTVYGRDQAAIARALAALAKKASHAAAFVPSLLLGASERTDSASPFKPVQPLPLPHGDRANDVELRTIRRASDENTITLWVDPKSALIHGALFDLPPGMAAIRDPTVTITIQPRANPTLEADAFRFEVPP